MLVAVHSGPFNLIKISFKGDLKVSLGYTTKLELLYTVRKLKCLKSSNKVNDKFLKFKSSI